MKPYIPPEIRAEMAEQAAQVRNAEREALDRDREIATKARFDRDSKEVASQLSALGQIASAGLVELSWFEVTDRHKKPARFAIFEKPASQYNRRGLVTAVKSGIYSKEKGCTDTYKFLSIDGEFWRTSDWSSELGVMILPHKRYDRQYVSKWAHVGDVVEGPKNERYERDWSFAIHGISTMIVEWVQKTGSPEAITTFYDLANAEAEQPAQA